MLVEPDHVFAHDEAYRACAIALLKQARRRQELGPGLLRPARLSSCVTNDLGIVGDEPLRGLGRRHRCPRLGHLGQVRQDRSRNSGNSGEGHRRSRATIVGHGRPHRRRIDEATPIFQRGREPSFKIDLAGDVEIVLGFDDARRPKILDGLVV